MTITLRDYQVAAIDSARAYVRETPNGNPLIVLPTGGGKGLIAGDLLRSVKAKGRRALYLTMTEELVTQTLEDLNRLDSATALSTTIACAALGPVDLSGDIVLGTAQSVYRRLDEIGERDLILVDEAHMIPRAQTSMYGQIFKDRKGIKLGLTATDYRLDTGTLVDGKDAPFTRVVYRVQTRELQKQGYLCELRYRKAKIEIDTRDVHVRGGEFVLNELEEIAVNEELCTKIADDFVAEYRNHHRRCALLFCVSIAHAKMMARKLFERGLKAAHLSHETPKGERRATIAAMRAGELEVLCNVNITAVGFNVPMIDFIGSACPTMSTGRWVQQVGRGLRTAQFKSFCLVRDYSGNLFRHGPVEDIERGNVQRGGIYAKTCEVCEAVVSRSAKKCPECGSVFPEQARSHLPPGQKVFRIGPEGSWFNVRAGTFTIQRINGQDTLRCSFDCAGRKLYSLWIWFDSKNSWFVARNRARWLALGGEAPMPQNAREAEFRANLGGELKVPLEVKVAKNGKGFIDVTDVVI